jgi:hypothetical protein
MLLIIKKKVSTGVINYKAVKLLQLSINLNNTKIKHKTWEYLVVRGNHTFIQYVNLLK